MPNSSRTDIDQGIITKLLLAIHIVTTNNQMTTVIGTSMNKEWTETNSIEAADPTLTTTKANKTKPVTTLSLSFGPTFTKRENTNLFNINQLTTSPMDLRLFWPGFLFSFFLDWWKNPYNLSQKTLSLLKNQKKFLRKSLEKCRPKTLPLSLLSTQEDLGTTLPHQKSQSQTL